MKEVLFIMSAQLAANLTNPMPPAAPKRFAPDRWVIRVNCLFLSSLICSLVAVFLAMNARTWVREYRRGLDLVPVPEERELRRHYRYEGLLRWKMPEIIAALPIVLHISLLLFFAALIDYLFHFHSSLGFLAVALLGLGVLLYLLSTALAAIVPSCPYRSPLSRAAHAIGFPAIYYTIAGVQYLSVPLIFLLSLLSLISSYSERCSEWLEEAYELYRHVPPYVEPLARELEHVSERDDLYWASLRWLVDSNDLGSASHSASVALLGSMVAKQEILRTSFSSISPFAPSLGASHTLFNSLCAGINREGTSSSAAQLLLAQEMVKVAGFPSSADQDTLRSILPYLKGTSGNHPQGKEEIVKFIENLKSPSDNDEQMDRAILWADLLLCRLTGSPLAYIDICKSLQNSTVPVDILPYSMLALHEAAAAYFSRPGDAAYLSQPVDAVQALNWPPYGRVWIIDRAFVDQSSDQRVWIFDRSSSGWVLETLQALGRVFRKSSTARERRTPEESHMTMPPEALGGALNLICVLVAGSSTTYHARRRLSKRLADCVVSLESKGRVADEARSLLCTLLWLLFHYLLDTSGNQRQEVLDCLVTLAAPCYRWLSLQGTPTIPKHARTSLLEALEGPNFHGERTALLAIVAGLSAHDPLPGHPWRRIRNLRELRAAFGGLEILRKQAHCGDEAVENLCWWSHIFLGVLRQGGLDTWGSWDASTRYLYVGHEVSTHVLQLCKSLLLSWEGVQPPANALGWGEDRCQVVARWYHEILRVLNHERGPSTELLRLISPALTCPHAAPRNQALNIFVLHFEKVSPR